MSEVDPTERAAPHARRHRTLAEAQSLVDRWRTSGQNQEAFCRSQNILRSTLDSCRRRVGDMTRHKRSKTAGFVQVVGPAGHAVGERGGGLIVTTSDGIRVQVADAEYVGLIAPTLSAIRKMDR